MKRWITAPLSKKVRLSAKDSPQAALRLAERMGGDDRLQRAADILDAALRRWPNSVRLLRARAAIAREVKEFQLGEKLLIKARELDSDGAMTLEALGLLYIAANRLTEAEAVLLQARAIAPCNASIPAALARLYHVLAKRLSIKSPRRCRVPQ